MIFNFTLNDKRQSPLCNIFMWTGLFIGQGVQVCLYCQEWYAQIHCPRTGVSNLPGSTFSFFLGLVCSWWFRVTVVVISYCSVSNVYALLCSVLPPPPTNYTTVECGNTFLLKSLVARMRWLITFWTPGRPNFLLLFRCVINTGITPCWY